MYKGYAYDESVRVPFVARWPGHIPAGRRSDALLGAPDIMPTLLDTLGLASHTPTEVQGTSLAGALTGASPVDAPDSAFLFNIADGWRGVRTARYTYYTNLVDPSQTVLFDNDADPFQKSNIVVEQPTVAQTLHARTLRWMVETGDPSALAEIRHSA